MRNSVEYDPDEFAKLRRDAFIISDEGSSRRHGTYKFCFLWFITLSEPSHNDV